MNDDLSKNYKEFYKGLRYAAEFAKKISEFYEKSAEEDKSKNFNANIMISKYPDPPSEIILPKESDLDSFYGAADKDGGYLTWFEFPPKANIRLYTRNGDSLKDKDGNFRMEHKCHKKIKNNLEGALLQLWNDLGDDRFYKEGLNVYSGCFNYRQKTGGGGLSTHCWACSVDFNHTENGFNSKTTTFSEETFNIFEKWGFLSAWRAWGKDPMHFQAAIPYVSKGSYYDQNGLPPNIKIYEE